MLIFKSFIGLTIRFAWLLAVFSLLYSAPAAAAIRFCNNTQNLLEAALGYREGKEWVSEGWWRIEPNQCTRVGHFKKNERLPHQFYYYAATVQSMKKNKAPVIWSGKVKFCTTADKAFHVKGGLDCETKGYQATGFQIVSIGNALHSYTLNFDDKESGKKPPHHT